MANLSDDTCIKILLTLIFASAPLILFASVWWFGIKDSKKEEIA